MWTSSLRSYLFICLLIAGSVAPGCSCDDETDAACGNGVIEGNETCDDGNKANGDGCASNCVGEGSDFCGNGVVEPPEECDDNNVDDGDGCSATCLSELCGNGMVDMDAGEECDDANNVDGDGCSASCLGEGECGNGIPEVGEACDDGNTEKFDGCEADCTASFEEVLCKALAPAPSGNCEVTAGDGSTLISGDVLTPFTLLRGGDVLVDANGVITCVDCDCSAQAGGATQLRCPDGIVSPGLINSHDHITFADNTPYTDTGERYEHRHDWRRGRNGHTPIGGVSGGSSTDEIRWSELRFLMGGATSTIGSGSASGFVRNLDRDDQEGLGQNPVNYSTFPLGDSNGIQQAAGCGYPDIETQMSIMSDDAYYPHVAEGIDAFARNEFFCVSASMPPGEDLLEPQSAFIHAIGLTPIDYARMADQGTSLIWSPRSNITLYGDTAVVTAAARLGVRIALGTDWLPSGSINMQRELQCADSLNTDYYDSFFTNRDLWLMATRNAAGSAAVDDVVGTLVTGMVADIAIFDGSVNQDHRAVIDAAPGDTTLVMRGGEVIYGDEALVAAFASGCDAFDVCGVQKSICASSDIGKSLSALTSSVGSTYPLFFCGSDPTNEPSCKPTRPVSVNGSTTYSGDASGGDGDGDGIDDNIDNCPTVFNPVRPLDNMQQADFDLDGDGDACDPCPLEPDVTSGCAGFNADDRDGDGLPNAMDNCPDLFNDGQADGDMDGKGDLCDACPTVSNMGNEACPATIYAIKTGMVTGDVAVLNALVTGCANGEGYAVQYKVGDADYAGADNSGIHVFDPTTACGSTVTVGDRVDLNPASVNLFFGQTQLSFAAATVLSSGEAAPAPVAVTAAQVAGTSAHALDGVVVQVSNALVTALEPLAGPGDSNPNNEFVLDNVLRVNDLFYLESPLPGVNTVYSTVAGILDFRNGDSKLEPRSAGDLVLGNPVLVGFLPSLSYVRAVQNGVPTIPTPLTVQLSGNVTSNTAVAISSSNGSALQVVGGGVTVLSGQSSATVMVNALVQNSAVGLTASLGGNMLNADVRVIGVGEQPQVDFITPSAATVSPSGTVSLDVFLNIPANNPGGNNVALSLSPGTFGSVPGSVAFAADQLSASFLFTAGSNPGTETVTATLNGSANALVDVIQGSALVINEVDYDQAGTDNDEFIEIFNASSGAVNLTGLALVLMNGSNDSEYNRIDLGPQGSLVAGEYLVVGSTTALTMVPMSVKTIAFSSGSNNIQNGAPDAIGILDVVNSVLIDAISYEGSVTMGNVAGAGVLSFVEGTATPEADANTGVGALIRSPNGTDSDNAVNDWAFSTTLTPGTVNVP